ncbi:class 1 fructose-bisphosphatase [Pseudoprimorskyibacter insulae]|uniref:Fructose-1,6-bisphosphatase class 1 n=1 Tax=Pseudoprimorskyibacter insulae TaxID=1695997 RepID=A0A2R8B053_9RHOB|nr:class 1 fructose-bisphosphatase [Pseudoprimorskyibacter insulae]SPF81651.1 Fructose-1,6-bisphosphatase class 1 [Pseudoprimorskyibacter insulae]
MTDTSMTFIQFLLDERRRLDTDRDLTTLLHSVATACKAISNALKNGALADVLGSLESENVQGETQKKLDVIANEIFLKRCEFSGVLGAMVSEEMDHIYEIPAKFPKGRYVLLFDPLDGSSNIDVNVSVGSIFSILKLNDVPDTNSYDQVLRPGVEQVAAGYALYGPSTMLVLSTGSGVHGFTLDGNIGEFRLTHRDITIPADCAEFAINMSREQWWEPPVQRYVKECVEGEAGPRGKYINMRWIASMVAEVHRVLMRGGVFMYPIDEKTRDKGGRLRLFYEANPMAFLIEQAGGAASTGRGRIMEVAPKDPHQRVPVILGSRNEVALIEQYHAEHDAT